MRVVKRRPRKTYPSTCFLFFFWLLPTSELVWNYRLPPSTPIRRKVLWGYYCCNLTTVREAAFASARSALMIRVIRPTLPPTVSLSTALVENKREPFSIVGLFTADGVAVAIFYNLYLSQTAKPMIPHRGDTIGAHWYPLSKTRTG